MHVFMSTSCTVRTANCIAESISIYNIIPISVFGANQEHPSYNSTIRTHFIDGFSLHDVGVVVGARCLS